ncbi:hypothetical protein ACHHYP_01124 [Achlya hypogyna]|uniref:Uncharacterized protein n=1 Tax=Achlya hypogyna TaxID=1202772 RepID=A0A1V9Z9K0_ACHHY|nr:hypothetical protein ACHHYP_01124 [Achlya hypogyna]
MADGYCVTDDKVAVTASDRIVVMGMEADENLVGAGMVHIRVFQGHVVSCGFTFPPGVYYDLYSPRWSNLATLVASTSPTASLYHAPCTDLTRQRWTIHHPSDPLDVADEAAADAIAKDMAARFPVVIVLRAMRLTYGNLASYFDGQTPVVRLPGFKFIRYASAPSAEAPPKKRAKVASAVVHDGEALFASLSSLEPNIVRELLFPASWHTMANTVLASFQTAVAARKVLVCGAKGVGKSTCTQFLVNRLLSAHRVVAYIDTDVGQPELCAPGVLSLHYVTEPLLGPGFTHLQPPFRSYYFGFSSPKADPTMYMQAIGTLLAAYTAKDPTIPLVINTDGWIKSMGHDLLHSILDCAAPQHVVQVVAMTKAKSFDVAPSPQWTLHPVEMWDAAPPQPARSSKELRQYRWHAYFLRHVVIDNPADLQLATCHAVSEQTRLGRVISMVYTRQLPYRVPFAALAVRVAGSAAPPSHILYALNASVVGLCVAPAGILAARPASDSAVPTVLLDNPLLPCVGHGIVRSIDKARGEFHILTPVPLALLSHVNVLVRGHLSLSFQLLDQNAVMGHSPYAVVDVLASEGTGASLMESRNNLKRKKEASDVCLLSQPALLIGRMGATDWIATVATVAVADVLSADETTLLELEFQRYDHRHRRVLDKLQATKLLARHMAHLSADELQAVFALQEGHGTFQLSLLEYIQVQAAKKLALELANEEDLKRHFTVLDYHGNGSLVADEILDALEKTGDAGVNILKHAVAAAAQMAPDGKITFGIFRQAIHDMNRATEAKIARDTLRLYQLQAKVLQLQELRRVPPKQPSSIEVECTVLEAQIARQTRELITVENDIFSKIYAAILSQYICENSVLRNFQAFFSHLHTEDSHLFRHGLERSGRMVDVHPSFLLYPGPVLQKSPEFAALCTFMVPDLVYDSHGDGPIFTNRAYRKVFLAYCLLGSLTNFQTISRSNFLRFVKDCKLTDGTQVRDPDIDTCYVLATRSAGPPPTVVSPRQPYGPRGVHLHFQPTPLFFQPVVVNEEFPPEASPALRNAAGMSFAQWVVGTTLVLQRCLGLESAPTGDEQEGLFRTHVLPHAKQIDIQPMGPEISQPQVMKFIHAHVWPLKQLFSHFGGHSLSHIEIGAQLSLNNFLLFARCFDILRSTKVNHRRNPLRFRQLSLQEVVQEYNAAKLDVGFSHTETRESLDLSFHEFLRCIQRLAMAMGRAGDPEALPHLEGQSLVSSFQYRRAELEPSVDRVHLFKHNRQLHAQDRHFSQAVELVKLRAATGIHFSTVVQRARAHARPLPPLVLEDIPTTLSPRKPAPETETKKCITPRQTHLPLVAHVSPRYSAHRPFSLGGSPRPRTVKTPPSPSGQTLRPKHPTPRPPGPPGDVNQSTGYEEYKVPLLSSSERSRTPYETTSIVVAHHSVS